MRSFWTVGLLLIASLCARGQATSDPNDRLYEFSTGAAYRQGKLDLFLYEHSRVWMNGRFVGRDEDELLLKPGDVVEGFMGGDYSIVFRFQLDGLTQNGAIFTISKYTGVTTHLNDESVHHTRGKFLGRSLFSLDLTRPNFALTDQGPEHVLSCCKPPLRSK